MVVENYPMRTFNSILRPLTTHRQHVYTCLDTLSDRFLPRRGLCRYAVSVYVRPSVSFVYSVKSSIFNFFHRRIATPFYFFRAKPYGNISTWNPLTVAGVVGKNRDSRPLSVFVASSFNGSTAKCYTHSLRSGGSRGFP